MERNFFLQEWSVCVCVCVCVCVLSFTKSLTFIANFPHQTPATWCAVDSLLSLWLLLKNLLLRSSSFLLPFGLSEESFPLQVVSFSGKCHQMLKMSLWSFFFRMIKSCSPLCINVFLFFLFVFFCCKLDSRLEGWISLPTKNTKRFGWDKKVMCPLLFSRI